MVSSVDAQWGAMPTTTKTAALAALSALLTALAACSDVSMAGSYHDDDGYTENEGDCDDLDAADGFDPANVAL